MPNRRRFPIEGYCDISSYVNANYKSLPKIQGKRPPIYFGTPLRTTIKRGTRGVIFRSTNSSDML